MLCSQILHQEANLQQVEQWSPTVLALGTVYHGRGDRRRSSGVGVWGASLVARFLTGPQLGLCDLERGEEPVLARSWPPPPVPVWHTGRNPLPLRAGRGAIGPEAMDALWQHSLSPVGLVWTWQVRLRGFSSRSWHTLRPPHALSSLPSLRCYNPAELVQKQRWLGLQAET